MKTFFKLVALLLAPFVLYAFFMRNAVHADELSVEKGDEVAIQIQGVKLTLGDAMRQAIEQNRDILAGSYDVAMSDSQLRQFQQKYAIFLNAEAGMNYAKYPDGLATFQGSKVRGYDVNASATRMFDTGTSVTGGVSHSYTKSDYPAISIPGLGSFSLIDNPEVHQPVFFVSVQQELLRNAFGYTERRQKEMLKQTGEMQKDAILQQLSMVVVGVVADYWNVLATRTAMDNAEMQLKETRFVRNIIARSVQLGTTDNFNLNFWNALLAGAEASVVQARKAHSDALRTFLASVNLEEGTSLDGIAYMRDTMPEINLERDLAIAYERRADYLNAKRQLKLAALGIDVADNEALPSLAAQMNASSLGYQDSLGPAVGDATSVSYPSAEARLVLSYSLDDEGRKVRQRDSRFAYRQAELNLQKVQRQVKDEITSSIEQIETAHATYMKAQKARAESELFYRRMVLNLRRGRLNATLLKDGLDAMVQSRQQELNALIYFNISLLQHEVAMNNLFTTYNIDVDRYIPDDSTAKSISVGDDE